MKDIQEDNLTSDEFSNLILAYCSLNDFTKKTKLLDIIKQNLNEFEEIFKNKHQEIKYENKNILETLDLTENEDFLTYVYVLELYINDYLFLLKNNENV